MEFKHPKYYKELRKRNKLDQAISLRESETSAGALTKYIPCLQVNARYQALAANA